ncbi:DUF3373 family protein [Sulfurovum mangrovi]|uniref:DUF3373 family protein n=1 Tax=Sulfurovum mangrovi TaxID=2893889 RepID=UPI001E5AED9D|nr:DUF3373 family protein [Sulfurovum mangrovi]UFH59315.1 DUF3373 domain-containing protein [Sulfurovum mangrovi]
MKKILTASLVTAMALTSVNASSVDNRISELETELAKLKKDLKKQNKKINEVKAHDAGDNIKWGADVRTAIDNINYDMASGNDYSKSDLMSLRLWLNMEYAADSKNIFKGQLSMNKAFGADFYDPMSDGYSRSMSMGGSFDWTGNEALTDNSLKVRQAYWLYLGDNAFGADIPWTFSLGRRPSTNGFLANLREDDAAQSPLGHVINVEFDGLSSKLDLSNVTGISGMSIKLCMGQGSTNAYPMLTPTQYANDDNQLEDITLAGFIFEPYNDGQFVTKATWYKAFDLPGMKSPMNPDPDDYFHQFGDMEGGAFSVLVDGLTDDGFLADTKVFASIAYSKTHPDANNVDGGYMLGSNESETGTSYWVGTQLPIIENGKLGLEYNHGSKYWRPFTYAEDTMIGSKVAARGDAYEAYFTYQLTDALSAQIRYTAIDYDYTGSNGFFGNYSGTPMDIDGIKQAYTMIENYDDTQLEGMGLTAEEIAGMHMAHDMADMIVDKAQDLRFYIRYRF